MFPYEMEHLGGISLFQQLFPLPVVRQVFCKEGVEAGPVVLLPDVAQFVHHHQVDGLLRVIHEKARKAKAAGAAAASVPLTRRRDPR